ncbi:MAG: chromate transporter [Lentihominibacter sp.]
MRIKNDKKLNSLKKYASLYWEFFKIGMFTIGGGIAMIPQIQQVAVKDKGWLTEDEMLDCIAISQAMPGVVAINSGTYIGRRIAGVRGAIAATAGVITPSFVIIILAVTILGAIGDNRYVAGAFTGVKAAVCGLILVTAVRLGRQSLKSAFQWILAIAAFICIGIFGINAMFALLAGAVIGIIYNYTAVRKKEKEIHSGEAEK